MSDEANCEERDLPGSCADYVYLLPERPYLFEDQGGDPRPVSPNTAERLCDCFHACQGIPDPAAAIADAIEALRIVADFRRPSKRDWDNGACRDEFDIMKEKAAAALARFAPQREGKVG